MADWAPTTVFNLIGVGVNLGMAAQIDKQLVRFGIAAGHADPNLTAELAAADAGLLDFVAGQLALAVFNHA